MATHAATNNGATSNIELSPTALQPQLVVPAGTAPPAVTVSTTATRNPLQLDTRVDQDGAFHQDKVLRSGWLLKRTRKTKGWKKRWFVLRADRLSCYKDQKEYKIHRQIMLSDVTAVAALKDSKHPFSFGVYSQAKNFQFRAENEDEVNDWTEKIWKAVHKEVPEQNMLLSSPICPGQATIGVLGMGVSTAACTSNMPPAPIINSPVSPGGDGNYSRFGGRRISTYTMDYSGPDVGSVSSLDDIARISQLSLNNNREDNAAVSGGEGGHQSHHAAADPQNPMPKPTRNGSGYSSSEQLPRVIWHGYLYCLKSKGGVKQWKKHWIVVKNVNIAFYKNEEEYRAIKILPLENIVDAVEIDPLSKTKTNCLQIITESKVYRFSADDEEVLVKALGAMKSALAKNKGNAPNACNIQKLQ
ncbi:hypothetical protein BZA77DRAFT_136855 [Pyronema omphalodes]|nr:hypothetical protein BZA77DRAFT_136855 [Pyronema omphalodes]